MLSGLAVAGLLTAPAVATGTPRRSTLRAAGGAATTTVAPAFECTFAEPFVSLWVGDSRVHGAGPDLAPTSAPVTATTESAGSRRVTITFPGFGSRAKAPGERLLFTKGAASDGMSGRRWGWSVRWRRATAELVGACERLGDRSVPRQVTALPDGQTLPLYAAADRRAQVLTGITSGAVVWRRPGPTNATWMRVEVTVVGDGGRTTHLDGYVDGTRTAPLP